MDCSVQNSGCSRPHIYPTLGDHGDCYEVLLPSATRHWMGGGAVFGQWHGSIFDRDRKRTYRLRVAPDGPSDYLVLPPSVLLNTEYPARGPITRGSLEAYLKLTIATSTFEDINSLPRTDPRLFEHTQKVNELVGAYIENNMARLRKYATSADSQNIDPEQAVEWYINLPPYQDPAHRYYGDALESAISKLEIQDLESGLTPDEKYLLASMHLESAVSFDSQRHSGVPALIGSFDRAGQLCEEAVAAAPEIHCCAIGPHFTEQALRFIKR